MFTKILFTLGLIAIVYLAIRNRRRPPVQPRPAAPNRLVPPKPVTNEARLAAWLLIAVMVTGTLVFLYFEWQDAYRVVDVRVINSESGKTVVYQAHKRDVEGRRFETVDGRVVTLAEVERLELGATE